MNTPPAPIRPPTWQQASGAALFQVEVAKHPIGRGPGIHSPPTEIAAEQEVVGIPLGCGHRRTSYRTAASHRTALSALLHF
jgi:hypothetical protein